MPRPSRARNHREAERAGRRAEILAALLLGIKGYRILARRRRAPRGSGMGEIDLIARRGRQLIAIEVKERSDHTAGLTSVTPLQRRRIERALAMFQAANPAVAHMDLRFDVITVVGWVGRHWPAAWRWGE